MHMHKLSDVIQAIILGFLALAGITIAIWDYLGKPSVIEKADIPGACLVMLGLIALSLALDRFTFIRRTDEKLDSLLVEAEEVHSLPAAHRREVRKALSNYVKLYKLQKKLSKVNKPFCNIADELLQDEASLLHGLAEGKLVAPEHKIPLAHYYLAKNFSNRLDAVSDNDLSFWIDALEGDPVAANYFNLNRSAAVKSNTAVTRIFIFKTRDLLEESDWIATVLKAHHAVGIGWGVAIHEELSPRLKALLGGNISKDFALFDGGMAVSYFRKHSGRQFEAFFATHKGHYNLELIDAQKQVYKLLVTECWLANIHFARLFPGALPSNSAIDEVADITQHYNEQFHDWVSKESQLLPHFMSNGQFALDHDIFALLAANESDIEGKVKLLRDIAAKRLAMSPRKHEA